MMAATVAVLRAVTDLAGGQRTLPQGMADEVLRTVLAVLVDPGSGNGPGLRTFIAESGRSIIVRRRTSRSGQDGTLASARSMTNPQCVEDRRVRARLHGLEPHAGSNNHPNTLLPFSQ